MKRRRFTATAVILFLIVFGGNAAYVKAQNSSNYKTKLESGWLIQSSQKVGMDGAQLSTLNYTPHNWYKAKVPSTVLGTLVDDGVYPDIFVGRNLDTVSETPFKHPWWYRKVFTINPNAGKTVNLVFNGIAYRANIWLNGHKIADADTTEGSFSRFQFDVSRIVNHSGKNVLAVQIFRPGLGDLRVGFVDWNPPAPDNDMGLWRGVWVRTTGPVTVSDPYVKSNINLKTLDHADLTVSVSVHNQGRRPYSGTVNAQIANIHISKKIKLAPGESKYLTFSPADYQQLSIDHPHLWWTWEMGDPYLYHLKLNVENSSGISDQSNTEFGIRQVSDYITKGGMRGYKLNGKKILVKGGGWTDHMLMNASDSNIAAQVSYARQMNLNALRMEGFWGHSQQIYKLCDEKGILIMVGWSCFWEWNQFAHHHEDKYGGIKSRADMDLATRMWKDQITWLRNHPSIFLWLYGSDKWPRPELERKFLRVLHSYDPTRPTLASAAEHTSVVTGPVRVKMRGPYDYVPPDYWTEDHKYGGAFGFNTETGPGPVIPVTESLENFIPKNHLWPIDSVWYYHAARGNFYNIKRYNIAMDQRLGKPDNLQDYEKKAQYMNYEGLRAMFEAFEANRFVSTGIIQWMYNASWPKLWWQLYDYYLRPTGAFYGTQMACQPVHLLYDYATRGVEIANNTLKPQKGLSIRAIIYNFDMMKSYDHSEVVNIPAHGTDSLFAIPVLKDLSKTYFLDLKMYDRSGKLLTSNFYVLSTQHDILDTAKSNWFVTPEKQYADLKMLNDLPEVKIDVKHHFEVKGGKTFFSVTLKNPTKKLAFFIHTSVHKGEKGKSVTPVFWAGNYITLTPGESRTMKGWCYTVDLSGHRPVLKVAGWNVK